MKAYKKSGFVSIFTMSLVIGLLSTALVVNAEGGNRRQKINKRHDVVTKTVTAEQADSSVDAEGGNRRLNINNHHSDGNNIKRVSHARTGRGGTKTVKFATSTKVTASLKGNHLVKP
ncbi:MAG: hypothetical protein GY775_16485 [Candidatus Scalindua sp.]|nr:hypothetical protein [Candidatus Scalindua sp.]